MIDHDEPWRGIAPAGATTQRLAQVLVVLLGACGRLSYRTSDASLDGGGEPPRDAALDAIALDAGHDSGRDLDAWHEIDGGGGANVDASGHADAGTDAAAASDAGVDTLCPISREQCNDIDDDCDGRVDEDFRVVATWSDCASPRRTSTITVVGSSWDTADALRSAALVEGGIELSFAINTPGALLLAPELTLGNLLVPPATSSPQAAALPFVGGDPALEPNVNRVAFEVGWDSSFVVYDGPGDDFVVIEQGDPVTEPEAFTVSVRDARTGIWSRRRWEFHDAFSAEDRLFATRYDLAQLGVPRGVIDRIRIESVFGADAAQPDRVTDPRGEGFVIRGDEADWSGASTLLLTAGGSAVPVNLLDADLVWVASLHSLVEPTCCGPS
ncbi:MAG: hypothetical protein U0353_23885 [Sandaracinus sp.]